MKTPNFVLLGGACTAASGLALRYGHVSHPTSFGIGLSPLAGLLAARIGAALFGLALIATGISAIHRRTLVPKPPRQKMSGSAIA